MNTKFALLAKRAFSHFLEDVNSETFRVLRTIRETSEFQLPTLPPNHLLSQSLSFICIYACKFQVV